MPLICAYLQIPTFLLNPSLVFPQPSLTSFQSPVSGLILLARLISIFFITQQNIMQVEPGLSMDKDVKMVFGMFQKVQMVQIVLVGL